MQLGRHTIIRCVNLSGNVGGSNGPGEIHGVKADVHVCQFVADAIGQSDVDVYTARRLVVAASKSHDGKNETDLDHAIWSWQRRSAISVSDCDYEKHRQRRM